jgi:folate-dependent phosphoribosylglycinamide formyltransferase PurN
METCSDVQGLVIQRYKPFLEKLANLHSFKRKINETWKFLRHWILGRVSREKEFFFGFEEPEFVHDKQYLKTLDINSEDVQNLVIKIEPDLILTFGCSILKNDTFFSIPNFGIINLHGGIVPNYRGVDNVYWSLYNCKPQHAGATIHYIDRTIDTGSYLAHVYPPVELSDDEYYLFNKTIKYGIDLFIKIMRDFDKAFVKLEGKLQDCKGHLYQEKDRTIFTDLKVFRYLRNPGIQYTRTKVDTRYYYNRL